MSKKDNSSDDMSWVFDSLVDFLRGPIWNIPMINFIEQKSMIFEPGGENQREYRRIHDEYKNLVDFMLGTYMEDIGITPAQFESACCKSSNRIKSQFHQMLFEQLWAADDFDMFQRMMIRTNIELQLQALELIQQRCGLLPASFQAETTQVSDEEKRVLEEVMRRSVLEHQQQEARMDQETRQLERTLAETDGERRRLEAERSREQQLIQETLKLSVSEQPSAGATPIPPEAKISAEEVAKRQAYLRQQRDKLLAMKRTERQKLLDSSEKREATKRPKSSRAARSAFAGKVDAKTLEMRKHLADALRREVVDKK
ncbi:cilia- and flagella-associated protein 36-like [Amphibalanus amphitrite]|uniref:cilia- and flagella-associated protein 36-like n=1 Tax=Amphibalanus amphitrite TaxID=1232801 RepID=UPI001C918140|nr:cilia- and flagella-associated protein 36-like [Amphibalanus amphitrite]XP_043241297.1 cilia- and flagella-associated protein 36-like [Amphibalanus amphitrite]